MDPNKSIAPQSQKKHFKPRNTRKAQKEKQKGRIFGMYFIFFVWFVNFVVNFFGLVLQARFEEIVKPTWDGPQQVNRS
jgi:hypothetical protein